MDPYRYLPIDPVAAENLGGRGLRLGLVDTTDRDAFAAWYAAETRGFHGGEAVPDTVPSSLDGVAYRRTTGVWDPTIAEPAVPVATVSSWPDTLTVPRAGEIQAWAISAVTVSPTHRRRGIARSLIQAELQTAHRLGLPVAALTVSEATIYDRFGFAPAAFAANLAIDTHRASWTGPKVDGRIHFIELVEFRRHVADLHERVRFTHPGQLPVWSRRWDEISGLASTESEKARRLRAVRYDDREGNVRGVAIYRLSGGEHDFAEHTLHLMYLSAETESAYAALWRFVLEMDLIDTLRADLRSVDEPVIWQLSDRRAVTASPRDHLWLRVLDVPAALGARAYSAAGRFLLAVSDDLGYVDGHYLLEIDDAGHATVSAAEPAAPAETYAKLDGSLAMRVNDLSALYLGGVSATSLAQAGLVEEHRPGSAAALEASFHSSVTPWLSFWF